MADRNSSDLLAERLREIGVQIKEQHFTGDNSYPVEYTLTYGSVSAMGPTLEMAHIALTEKLVMLVPVEQAQQSGECVECGRNVTALNAAGVCEGCVLDAQIE